MWFRRTLILALTVALTCGLAAVHSAVMSVPRPCPSTCFSASSDRAPLVTATASRQSTKIQAHTVIRVSGKNAIVSAGTVVRVIHGRAIHADPERTFLPSAAVESVSVRGPPSGDSISQS
jgi:hypothetical protein